MLRLTVCLLFATAIFAQHYDGSRRPSSYPLDFNDDIYNRDMRGPPERLVFNFEQRRIDQPPQYELRDENLRQYMGRPMTTTPVPEFPIHVADVEPNYMHHLPGGRTTESPKPSDPKKWGPMASHLPATLPPAPAMLKWMDMSDESIKYQGQQAPSRTHSEYYQPSATTQPPMPMEQWNNHPAPQHHAMDTHPQYQAYQPTQSYVDTHPRAEPMRENQKPMSAEEFVRPTGRGNHKFSWSDVKAQEPVVPTTIAPAVPMKNRNPPPSIPTLTPWQDGFGK